MGEVKLLSKNDFINYCGKSIENADKLYSTYVTALKSGQTIIPSEFYIINVCNTLKDFLPKNGINVLSYGFSDDAERCLIAFSTNSEDDVSVFDNVAKIIKITYNNRFNKLSHRDFLGSIMSLGFTREKMGDLVVQDNCVYIPVVIEFVDYIMQNLTKVRHSPVNVTLELFNRLPQKEIEILYKVVSSLRIDNIVSVLTNLSREKAKGLIRENKVKLNSMVELNPDRKVCENDIIVISGFGKFKIRDSLGYTSKNKTKLIVDKFI